MSSSGLSADQINQLLNAFGGTSQSSGQISAGLGGTSLPTPPTYSPVSVPQLQGGQQLDQQLIDLLSSQSVFPSGGINAGLESVLPQITSNPYTGGLISSAQQAGTASGQQGQQDISGANTLFGAATASLPDLQSLLVQAFDPQQQLQKQLSGQLTDNINASLAGSGLLGSPVGAGVLGTDLGNFDVNWQNNLLNRMVTGLGAYGQGVSNIGSNLTNAANLGNTGVSAIANAGALPYGAQNTATSNTLSQLLQLLGGQNSQLGTQAGALNNYQSASTSRLGTGIAGASSNYQNQDQQYQQALKSLAGLFSGSKNPAGSTGLPQGTGDTGYGYIPQGTPAPAYGQAPDPYAQNYQPGNSTIDATLPGGSYTPPPTQPIDNGLSNYIPPNNYGPNDYGPGSDFYTQNQQAWSDYTGDSGEF